MEIHVNICTSQSNKSIVKKNEEDVVPGGGLNLNSTNLPRLWSPWESSPSRKISKVEPGIEPGTS